MFIDEKYYKIAKANGIPRRYVNDRVKRYGWTIERAITQPCNRNIKKSSNITYDDLSNMIFYLIGFDEKFKRCKSVNELLDKLDETPNKIIKFEGE